MDASGAQLAAGGWLPLARMFIPKRDLTGGPVVVLFDTLEVIGGYSISDPMMEGHDSARLSVRYSYLGDIDYKSLSFSRPPPSPTAKVRRNYHLLYTAMHYDIGSQGEEKLLSGSKTWRIEGLPPEPHSTVEAAILYVRQLRNKTTSDAIKKNANVTIEALKRLRPNTEC